MSSILSNFSILVCQIQFRKGKTFQDYAKASIVCYSNSKVYKGMKFKPCSASLRLLLCGIHVTAVHPWGTAAMDYSYFRLQ